MELDKFKEFKETINSAKSYFIESMTRFGEMHKKVKELYATFTSEDEKEYADYLLVKFEEFLKEVIPNEEQP